MVHEVCSRIFICVQCVYTESNDIKSVSKISVLHFRFEHHIKSAHVHDVCTQYVHAITVVLLRNSVGGPTKHMRVRYW